MTFFLKIDIGRNKISGKEKKNRYETREKTKKQEIKRCAERKKN